MKILHLIASTGVGGAEKHLLDLCLQQRAFGLDVSVALPQEGALSQALQSHGIDYALIHTGGRWHPLALWSLRRVIRRIRPDLVHAHMLKSAAMAGIVCRPIPCVATAHNIVKNHAPFRHCRHVICVSDMVRDSLIRSGYSEAMTTVVHNAVDTRAFNNLKRDEVRRLHGWQDQLIVLCVARLVPAKGQRYAIEALPQLLVQLPAIRLVLAGEGEDREALLQLAAKLGVSAHLALLGSRNDIADLLAATDIYLQPSIKEGFCIAFLEAMATGLACIGTETGAIPAMLKSGINGVLIHPADSAAIVDAVLSIATDADRRRRYQQAAKITANTQFSPQKQMLDTLAVYRQVLNR
ncbi:MAG: glycosyltransferase family 4 protein [Sulfuriferula sp.]|nr:glycosyltransferase family 4 protein [Sulfuriferula sp.]